MSSKVNWSSHSPKSWNVTKIKFTASGGINSFTDGDWIESPFITNEGIRLIQTGNVGIGGYKEQGFRYITKDTFNELNCKEVFPGDILICRLASPVGRSCIVPDLGTRMITSVDNCILRPSTEFDSRYLNYQFSTKGFLNYVDSISRGGTRSRISRTQLGDLTIYYPPLIIQQRIADFLDQKYAMIDSLIEKKQKLVELKREERTALINQAVTKGLDTNVPMKDSGIEWLGEIPEHWEVKKLKYLINGNLKYGANEPAEIDNPEYPRYIRITDFDEDGKLRKDTFKSLPPETVEEYYLKEGDILFARSGATVGKTFQFKDYTGLACFAGYLIKATPDANQILSDYLYFFTKTSSYYNWKNGIFIQATIQNIGADKYGNLYVSLPPIDEQHKIMDFISSIHDQTNYIINSIERQVELLKEYKTTLISEAVTGKLCL